MSLMRRTVSSWRWPFLTRLRALGRYLNEMVLGPRIWLTTSALTWAPLDDRLADAGLVAVGDEEHAVQGDRLAGLDVEELDLELGADLDAVLLPAGLDDCVHGSSGWFGVGRPGAMGRDGGHGDALDRAEARTRSVRPRSCTVNRARLRRSGRYHHVDGPSLDAYVSDRLTYRCMDAQLRAIAEPNRRAILRLVRDREMTAGAIAARFDVTRPAISQHLAVLREAGLLDERRDGVRRWYRARPAGVADLRAWLEAFWDDGLDRLKAEAEQEARDVRRRRAHD